LNKLKKRPKRLVPKVEKDKYWYHNGENSQKSGFQSYADVEPYKWAPAHDKSPVKHTPLAGRYKAKRWVVKETRMSDCGHRPVKISIAKEVSPTLLEGVRNLIPSLSETAAAPTPSELKMIVESPATILFVATEDATPIGMLTLVLVRIPSGLRAHIEDVVVAPARRRKGVARALTLAALDAAKQSGARTIDLTSRPARKEAIQLYESLGFQRRDTGVFRFAISSN
jgi:GNAT superfamily N-acetyltransferase